MRLHFGHAIIDGLIITLFIFAWFLVYVGVVSLLLISTVILAHLVYLGSLDGLIVLTMLDPFVKDVIVFSPCMLVIGLVFILFCKFPKTEKRLQFALNDLKKRSEKNYFWNPKKVRKNGGQGK
jgi:hypothetical protein